MDPLACVEIGALPLQLLLRRHPEWRALPAAVVDKDQPLGVLLWVNEPARRAGILPGQKYAAALSLCRELRAAEMAVEEIAGAVQEITELFRRFSPEIEPSPVAEEPGIFWINAAGLLRLYPSLTAWGEALLAALSPRRLVGRVAIGFHRFGVYAAVRAQRQRVLHLTSVDEERRHVAHTPLTRIGLLPATTQKLDRLAVRTVGDFLALPPASIRRRFGVEAHRLHQLAQGSWAPLKALAPVEPHLRVRELDDAQSDVQSLIFLVKQELDPLITRLGERGQAVAEVTVTLRCDAGSGKTDRAETIRPAEPTLDGVQLLGLIRLRLESLQLGGGVWRLSVHVGGVAATAEQLRLWAQKPRRDPRAAARAIARLRAALGEQAVVRAQLREAHLPEARYSWEPFDAARFPVAPVAPSPKQPPVLPPKMRPLIRRIGKPVVLPDRPAREPDGWLLDGIAGGPVVQSSGPHLVSGGWWHGDPSSAGIERDYYFAELKSGALHWVYYDRRRRVWFRQGKVE